MHRRLCQSFAYFALPLQKIMLDLIKKWIPLDLKIRLFYQLVRLRGKFDFGNQVECPVCGSHFGRFDRFGRRPNVLCPSCFSLERHRLQYLYLKERTGIFTEALRVLHFAPEKCLSEKIAENPRLEYETADLLIQFIELIEVKPRHRMSITDIRFPDNHFDIILCNHVLEHVPDDRKAMSELFRVLKPGGFGITQVPINPDSTEILEDMSLNSSQRALLYGSPDHLRYYSEPGFTARLREAGFEVEVNDFVRSLDYARMRLQPTENLIIVRKPSGNKSGS